MLVELLVLVLVVAIAAWLINSVAVPAHNAGTPTLRTVLWVLLAVVVVFALVFILLPTLRAS